MRWNRKLVTLWILLVAVLTAVYSNHFDNTFHFDDRHTIVNNQYITDIANIPLFFADAKTTSSLPTNQAYRPVVTTLNAIDYWIAGKLDPRVFHWHIYIEFVVLLFVLFFIFTNIFKASSGSDHPFVALLGVAFFAFHTATAETLNYIISRSDGFSTLMVLLGLLIYIRSSGWKKQLGLLPFILGCLTKPTALMLAPLLAVYSFILERPSLTADNEATKPGLVFIKVLRQTASYFLLGLALYIFTRSMFSSTWTPGGNYSGLEYLNTQAYVIWIYVKVFFIPTGLTADTDLQVIREFFAPRVIWGLSVILSLILIAIWASTRRRTLPIAFGITWFFIALVPSSSVIPLAEVLNHHRTFFPYIGLAMATVWGGFLLVSQLSEKKGKKQSQLVAIILALLAISAHAFGTYQRNEVWDSSESLWKDVALKSPNNGRGLMNYGLTFMSRGDLQEAIEYFEKARGTEYGNHPYLHLNLGIAKNALATRNGSPELKKEAERYFKQALLLGPGYPQVHHFYAGWLYREGRFIEAENAVNRALKLSPGSASSLKLLENIKVAKTRGQDYDTPPGPSIRTPEEWLNLSVEQYRAGHFEECIESAKAALEIRPDYALAYNNICSALIKLGEYENAIEACNAALRIDPNFERAKANLDWARKSKEILPKQ